MCDCEHIFYSEHCDRCGRNAEAIIDDLEQQLRWIPVSERLPEQGERFLVYDTFYEKHEAIECVRIGRMTDSWGIAPEGMNGKCPTITHWKPITAPETGSD